MLFTRREWTFAVAGSLVGAPLARLTAQSKSVVTGVRLGAQTYVFRGMPLDQVPAAFKATGLSFAELWSGHVETAAAMGATEGMAREARRELLRTWRTTGPLSAFEAIRARFADAGVTLTSYDVPYRDDWSDAEITRSFEIARALGVSVITSSAGTSVVPRVAKLLEGSGVKVSFHNHSSIRPGEFATPDDFTTAMKASPNIGVTLDIGHFTAANFDAVKFLDEHHDRIHAMHIKDRKRDQGAGVPFGQGDAPIVAVLQRLRDRKWDIPAHIEFDYRPADAVAEVTTCYEYCRKALETR
ncbi:MAG TPA: sugar phosphate isomerase/epimerase [Vicinamibacterales bacterium]|nr:sugar phosphate isomerase/epimerase [Vicinamibacterales bacterium]